MRGFEESFYRAYCASMGHDPEKTVQAYVERELSPRYPVVLKQAPGRLIVGVAPQIADACGPIERQFGPDAAIGEVIGFLFDEQITFVPDESLVAGLDPQRFCPSEEETRPLTRQDARGLRALNRALTPVERQLSQVSLKDDLTVGVFDGETLVCAASLLRTGALYDVGVMTHPEYRGRGYARAAVSALCRTALEKGWTVQYRADQTNPASVWVMTALGFAPVLHLHGAVIHVKGENHET